MYDVIVIGAGVIGASVAKELSKHHGKFLVLEKEADVGDGASSANSAIIHSGYDPIPGTLKAKFNVLGNPMFDELCKDLDVEFKRIGSITLANDLEEVKILHELADRSSANKVPYQILNHDELKCLEPAITDKVIEGLFCRTAGIINPFELVVALMENAMDNGVELRLNEEVVNIIEKDDYYEIVTINNTYEAKNIVNASGVYSSKINDMVNPHTFEVKPRKGEYFVIDHYDDEYLNHTLFNVPSEKGKGVLVSPTTHQNYLIGPSSEFVNEFDDVSTDKETLDKIKFNASRLTDFVNYSEVIREFSGLRAVSDRHDFIIEKTKEHFINLAGIESPGLTSAPAIAKYAVEELLNLKDLKDDYNPKRRPLIRLNKKSALEKEKLTKENPTLGKIICRCEVVSLGEILDTLNRNCAPTTVKGVKKRVRPGFGKCQGGFCQPIIMHILADYYHKKLDEITLSKENAVIVKEETKVAK